MSKDNGYTLELEEVLDYMSSVLSTEFPTDVLRPEYLVLSILDVRDCHANMILDNCLMSNNIDELRKAYVEVIEKNIKPQLKESNAKFNDELVRILNCARIEADKLANKQVGTEHVLLAILNKDNKFKEESIFGMFMLQYDFIFGKCNITSNRSTKLKPKKLSKKNPSSSVENDIPLKSQVNTKAVASNAKPTDQAIAQYTISLNRLALNGKIDDIVGRSMEIEEIVKVLCRRKKNNAILVGKGGCGKTAIVYGLAKLIVDGKVPTVLEGKEIVMMNQMALVSGTHFRGMFEERMKSLIDALQKDDKYILFIDDIHTVVKSGSKEKDGDISGMIGEILSEGFVKVIATTTFKDYRNAIESNTQLNRKFQKIIIEQSTTEESIRILEESKHYYEDFHKVRYTDEAIEKAVLLADRYITDRSLPDSAFDIIDLAGAKTSLLDREPIEIQTTKRRMKEIENEKVEALNNGLFERIDSLTIEENVLSSDLADYNRDKRKLSIEPIDITEADVADVVSEITMIPVSKLSVSEKAKIAHIDETLKKSIIGQDEAVDSVCKVIKRNKVGLGNKNKTMANILMCGGSGTGKTLVAKKLAEEIFGDEKALIRIDMSEYSEKNSVSKLTGAAPGYVGFENGGQLTEAVKHKQHCVLLLDEIEKADEEVYNIFLQLFDEGRLTDSSGQIVNFKNVIVLMTSNVGSRKAAELGGGLGFVNNENENKKSIIEKELRRRFSPEFLNRLDKIVHFNSLSKDNIKDIVKLELNKFNNRLNNINYNISYNDDIIDNIHSEAVKDMSFGARPIIRLIQDKIEDRITDLLLEREYEKGYTFKASCKGGDIVLE